MVKVFLKTFCFEKHVSFWRKHFWRQTFKCRKKLLKNIFFWKILKPFIFLVLGFPFLFLFFLKTDFLFCKHFLKIDFFIYFEKSFFENRFLENRIFYIENSFLENRIFHILKMVLLLLFFWKWVSDF